MKTAVKAGGIILGVVIVAAAVLLIQAGLLYKTAVQEAQTGPYTLVYLEHTGDYSKSAQVQMEVYNKLIAEFGINTTKGFGIYFDDPAVTPKDKLRSEVGCILEGEDIKKAAFVSSKFKVKTLEKKQGLVVEHPFNSPLSIMIGIYKAYPLINKFVKDKSLPYGVCMEIYDVPAKKILYISR